MSFKITDEFRRATAGPTTQLCPDCHRPNIIGQTELRVVMPDSQYLFGFRAIIGQECSFCHRQIVAAMDCIRKGGEAIFEKCMEQAMSQGKAVSFEPKDGA